jgi:hypothetical protein
MRAVIGTTYVRFDKGGENFYDQISALHKSVRGSDPDAALYWLCRMLAGGCDPLYIARRALRMASEDIGNADPRALSMALEACMVYERLGSPEGELAIAQAIVFMSCAAKSNAVYTRLPGCRADATSLGSLEVPLHLRNAPTRLMKEIGYGKGYRYAHDEPDAYAAGERYFPEGMPERRYYSPVRAASRSASAKRSRRGARANPDAPLSSASPTIAILMPLYTRSPFVIDPKLLRSDLAEVAAQLARRGFVLDLPPHSRRSRSAARRRRSRPTGCAPSAMPMPRPSGRPRPGAGCRGAAAGAGEAMGAGLADAERTLEALQAQLDGAAARAAEPAACERAGRARRERERRGAPLGYAARDSSFEPKDHVAIGAPLGMDFEAAGRISGARFVVMTRRAGAPAPRADPVHARPACAEHGYREAYVPYLVHANALLGTGQLPKFEQDLFAVRGDPGFLPDPDRRSAGDQPGARPDRGGGGAAAEVRGAYAVLSLRGGRRGKDTRGMIRQHQFEKVELVQIVRPVDSYAALEELTGTPRRCCRALGLPYRVGCAVRRRRRLRERKDLRPGGVAAVAAEVPRDLFLQQLRGVPGAAPAGALAQPGHRQAGARAHAERIRGGRGRALVAILENYQQADGSVTLPSVLAPYMGGLTAIIRSVAVAHHQAQRVPEHQRDRGEQLHRRRHIAVFRILVDDVRRVVQHRRAGEADHQHREPGAQLEAEYGGADDRDQREHAAPHQDRAQEREVPARAVRDEHQAAGAEDRDQRGAVDRARRLRIGDVQQRHEDQRLGQHVHRIGEVLHAERGAGLGGARREPPGQHERAHDQQPVEAEHEAGDIRGEPGLEQRQLDQDEAEDSAHDMRVGARDEFAAAVERRARKGGVVALENAMAFISCRLSNQALILSCRCLRLPKCPSRCCARAEKAGKSAQFP